MNKDEHPFQLRQESVTDYIKRRCHRLPYSISEKKLKEKVKEIQTKLKSLSDVERSVRLDDIKLLKQEQHIHPLETPPPFKIQYFY